MSSPSSSSILITGASSGIGRALAQEFARRGHRVFAASRRMEAMEDLKPLGIQTFHMDVTDAESIREAVRSVEDTAGAIDILVNNAGYGAIGPLAEIPLDELRRQLETNVVGAVAVTQAVVPAMMRRGAGRVVMMGSASGVLATPFAGAYCASKAALHALSEALRMELKPFGVDVIVVRPGGIQSEFGENSLKTLAPYRRPEALYHRWIRRLEARAVASQRNPTPVDVFARQCADAILRRRAPRIVKLGHGVHWMHFFERWAPKPLVQRALRREFGLDGKA